MISSSTPPKLEKTAKWAAKPSFFVAFFWEFWRGGPRSLITFLEDFACVIKYFRRHFPDDNNATAQHSCHTKKQNRRTHRDHEHWLAAVRTQSRLLVMRQPVIVHGVVRVRMRRVQSDPKNMVRIFRKTSFWAPPCAPEAPLGAPKAKNGEQQ